jgi:hypothetical protein
MSRQFHWRRILEMIGVAGVIETAKVKTVTRSSYRLQPPAAVLAGFGPIVAGFENAVAGFGPGIMHLTGYA